MKKIYLARLSQNGHQLLNVFRVHTNRFNSYARKSTGRTQEKILNHTGAEGE